jgi:hypothetical protein
MSDEVRIEYDLGDAGWSSFRLTVGTASVVVGPCSYLTDALGDLVRAALMIATTSYRAEVSFDSEPMEWRLIIQLDAQSHRIGFRLKVLTFPSLDYPPSPEAEGQTVFDAPCSADSFARAVLGVAQAIWDEHGAEGYDKAWCGSSGFPLRGLNALKAALSVQEPQTTWLVSDNKSSGG